MKQIPAPPGAGFILPHRFIRVFPLIGDIYHLRAFVHNGTIMIECPIIAEEVAKVSASSLSKGKETSR